MIAGKETNLLSNVSVKRGGKFDREIDASTIDATAKIGEKNVIVLKVNRRMQMFEKNAQEEMTNIMAAGEMELTVDGEIIKTKPLQFEDNPKTGKSEIIFERVL